MTDQIHADPVDQVAQAERIARAAADLATVSACSYRTALAIIHRSLGLIRERDAMADALTAVTHEFEDVVDLSHCYFVVASDDDAETLCWQPFADPVHRTPVRVRAELEATS